MGRTPATWPTLSSFPKITTLSSTAGRGWPSSISSPITSYFSSNTSSTTRLLYYIKRAWIKLLTEKSREISTLLKLQVTEKGIVASYQAALSEEYLPLERVQPVLTWSRQCPGYDKMVSEDQIQQRGHIVWFLTHKIEGLFFNIIGGSMGEGLPPNP